MKVQTKWNLKIVMKKVDGLVLIVTRDLIQRKVLNFTKMFIVKLKNNMKTTKTLMKALMMMNGINQKNKELLFKRKMS